MVNHILNQEGVIPHYTLIDSYWQILDPENTGFVYGIERDLKNIFCSLRHYNSSVTRNIAMLTRMRLELFPTSEIIITDTGTRLCIIGSDEEFALLILMFQPRGKIVMPWD